MFNQWFKYYGKFLLLVALGLGLGKAFAMMPFWMVPYAFLGIALAVGAYYSYARAKIDIDYKQNMAKLEEERKTRKRPRRTVF